jgi:hypothetical protein
MTDGGDFYVRQSRVYGSKSVLPAIEQEQHIDARPYSCMAISSLAGSCAGRDGFAKVEVIMNLWSEVVRNCNVHSGWGRNSEGRQTEHQPGPLRCSSKITYHSRTVRRAASSQGFRSRCAGEAMWLVMAWSQTSALLDCNRRNGEAPPRSTSTLMPARLHLATAPEASHFDASISISQAWTHPLP